MGSSETVRTVQIAITGTSAQLQKALTDAGLVGDETSAKIGTSIDTATTKAGGAISKLGQTASNMGIPFAGALTTVGSKFDEADTKGQKFGQSMSTLGGVTLLAGAAGFAVVGAASIKAAGNFQTAMTQLVTGAGESKANIDLVSNGILNMAGKTGTSADVLAKGMFTVESAGYHGAAGLQVLQVAAEGAKVGGADLSTVTDAVTSALNAYGLKGKDATSVMNELVATVASGKMHMQDLAGALSAVTPTAAAAHISLSEVGGAIATMTAQGTSAQQAAQDLANTIRSLQNPSQTQIGEMEQLGLNANTVATQLGQRGLSGTMSILVSTITSHMGPAGTVLLNSFKQSESAGADAKKMIGAMPASLQTLASAFLNGTVTQSQWRAELKKLPVDQRELATQFASTANASRGFNDTLKSGSPQAQTFNAALSKVMGGSTGLSTALQLTGGHMGTFTSNVASVYNASTKTSGAVSGWSEVQKDFNFKLDQAKSSAQALEIRFGNFLLPKIVDLMHAVQAVVGWFEKHKLAAEVLGGVIAGVLAAAIAVYIVNVGTNMVAATQRALTSLGLLGDKAAVAGSEVAAAGTEAEVAGGKFAGAGAAAGESGMAGSMTAGEGAATGLAGALLPLAAALVPIGMAAYAMTHANDGLKVSLTAVSEGARLNATTLPQMGVKLDALRQAQEAASQKIAQGGLVGEGARKVYDELGSQIDTLRGQQSELSSNLTVLSSNFGISQTQVQSVAQSIGVDLTSSLDKPQVSMMAAQIQNMGLNADTAGGKVTAMSADIVVAMSQAAAGSKAAFDTQDWDTVGVEVVRGVAQGINSSASLATLAASGAAEAAITAARHTINAQSPSKRAADEIGLPFVQGIAMGIAGAARLVTSASSATMTAAFRNYSGSSVTPIASSASSVTAARASSAGGTLAMLANAAQDEAAIPLGARGGGKGLGRMGDGAGTTIINHNNITITNPDPQAVVNQLRIWMQRNGSLAGAGIN